jgi:hypothetical protein
MREGVWSVDTREEGVSVKADDVSIASWVLRSPTGGRQAWTSRPGEEGEEGA